MDSAPAKPDRLNRALLYANGIAFGFISYAALKLHTGRARGVAPIVWIIAAVFVLRYAYLRSE